MRVTLSAAFIASSLTAGAAFTTPTAKWGIQTRSGAPVFSTVEADITADSAASAAGAVVEEEVEVKEFAEAPARDLPIIGLTGAEIKARLETQLEHLRKKDATSAQLSKEDIQVVFEDEHIVVVNKQSKVLTVSGNNEFPNLAQAVHEGFECELASADRMVVHRLGMDTSGLIVFAKTLDAVRGMNTVFRTRSIERKYEALVSGHVEKDQGVIDLPIMRDYEFPPYVRISTDNHQAALVDLDPLMVGKKLLEQPKDSLTKYEVVGREEFDGHPVTRVTLASISGRYHQLNAHMAAFGHAIVGDTTYGIGGDAAHNGGLSDSELETMAPNPNRVSAEIQQAIADVATVPCVHAKSLKFQHPVTNEDISLSSDAPF